MVAMRKAGTGRVAQEGGTKDAAAANMSGRGDTDSAMLSGMVATGVCTCMSFLPMP